MLAAVYSEGDQAVETWAVAAEVLELNPTFYVEVHRQRMPIFSTGWPDLAPER
jgi:hypothetical protein